jgi:hypothetical protein
MKRNLITYFLLLLLVSSVVYAGPRTDGFLGSNSRAVIKAQSPLEANDIRSFIWNTGVFNQDLRTNNTPGFEWPKNNGKFAIFTTGLSLGALYEGNLRMANASYNGEYAPGTIEGGNLVNDSRFKIYNVKAGDNQFTNPDYANWGLMVPYGAPYVDIDNNGSYDVNVDIPGIKDAAQTIFVCLTDADPSNHTPSEGFGGGTAPLSAEVRLTAWAYSTPGLEKIQFIQWAVINKSPVVWDATHFGIVCDPDLGDATDDYIGCDTLKNLAFCYNSDNVDGDGSGVTYGANPPASGMDYFISPIIPTGDPNDTVTIFHPPGSNNKITKVGFREIGLTSFVYFTNTGSAGPVCERDPSSATESYNYLKGIKKDGTPWINPLNNQIAKYCYSGDPESNTGWNEQQGRIENCNGTTTGTVVTPTPSGDRRLIFNSGATNFSMNPNDTQFIVLAQLVARGSDNKNSVTQLKNLDATAQTVYDLNFKVIPPPPPPAVNLSSSPNSTLGTVNVTLSWGDVSEYYDFEDQLFGTGRYKFQGYEVYEIRKDLSNVPDLLDPRSDKSGLSLLAVFDRDDSVGVILDSLRMGISVGGVEQYGYFPVVPAYPLSITAGLNTGLARRMTINGTRFVSVNGNSDKFIYGNTYKFAVVAYAYNPNGLRGGKIIRNSLSSQIIEYTPEAPTLGTQFYFKDGDTLNTNRRDLGLMPIVVDQEKVLSAKYRIQFGGSDTTYTIYRSFDGGANYDVLKSNLKYTNIFGANNTTVDDSSRVFDGIVFKVQKMRWVSGNPSGNYTGNVGVIQDPLLARDSIQTRYKGWDYLPAENNPYDSSRYTISPAYKPYQSKSMSISYPTRNTYIGFRSQLNPESLRKVKIVFTGYGNGQQSYRYLSTGAVNFTYQDMREVPFKVYEIDYDDGTAFDRQVNCGFLEFPDGAQDNKWEPTADSTGGKEVLYIFNSDYNATPGAPYTTTNLFLQQANIDVMYVWAPRAKTAGATFRNGDQFIIYPYTVTRSEIAPGSPLFYDVDTRAPIVGSTQIAVDNNGLADVKVVPNPYYGYNSLESSTSGRFVTFRNLPTEVTIKIYSLNGDLIKNLSKKDNNSTLRWNMSNINEIPIASGIYIALLDAPGIGTRSIKIAVFTPEERIDF